jgi:hypothetical protein
LTGYRQKDLETQLKKTNGFRNILCAGSKINPARALIKGIKEPTMREIRYLDKLIDELAKGKAMDKILRKK